ncbi:hypothetical protein SKAU_G00004590 [Synaphobranchus kaupii]|uniref:Protein PAXX n=1 Tax=Synaphobranchus kaupii TaxID=118154 RepID=A0A9Q1G8V5_SYNKA|nr:hypothetical protein SKAU_G00004590 [Synaphobranchus kaupii]
MDHGALQTKSAYCNLVNKSDNSKYVCYAYTKTGTFIIGLTNASEVWSKDFTKETLAEHGKSVALKSAEDYISKIRSACGNGSASVTVQEDGAVLQLGASPGSASVTLPRLSDPEDRAELRDLLFRMADCLTHTDVAGGPSSFSPGKSQFKRNTGFEPRRQQTGPTVVVKKRLPGDSLINPGSRKKRPATGVAFDDNDDL